jgi:vacuolar-type H+-ATPase subunit I/STV1
VRWAGTPIAFVDSSGASAIELDALRMETTMQPQTIVSRVERLEERVTALEQLPARMDAFELQLLQFRDEVRAEFSATRGEMRAGDEETRRTLREEIREGDERILTQARVLHEEVLARLEVIHEAGPRRRKRR